MEERRAGGLPYDDRGLFQTFFIATIVSRFLVAALARIGVSLFASLLEVSSVMMTPCAASQRYRGALRSAIANDCRGGLIRWPNSVASRPRSSRSNRRQFQMMTCGALLRCRKTCLFIQLPKCSSLGARVTPPPGLSSAMIAGEASIQAASPAFASSSSWSDCQKMSRLRPTFVPRIFFALSSA